jgi:TRAP-type mannitol/chloroaromatic compound transport system permease small subunit
MSSLSNLNIPETGHQTAIIPRIIGWCTLAFVVAFLINNVLTLGFSIPSGIDIFENPSAKNFIQPIIYLICFTAVIYWVVKTPDRILRRDARQITNFNTYFIRGCFFAVLFVGIVDSSIAWLRVESLLPLLFNAETASALLRSNFIGPMIHIPLIITGFIVAIFSRSLGFTWLTLMIVSAELLIVISRFVFSYEQTLMGDLVRYWYGALFLFASAYTLLHEGHVRVDILYAGFNPQKKGKINAYGSIFLGMITSITILLICLWSKQSIVNGPVMIFEISQNGTAGMYIKYQMAVFLLIFAITMQIQFVSYFLEAIADIRNEPGRRETAPISD